MESQHESWQTINDSSDAIQLLKLIQVCMNQRQTSKYDVHTLIEAEIDLTTFKQGQYVSNNDYYNRFKDKMATALQLGSSLGANSHHVNNILADNALDTASPTSTELATATEKAQDKYFTTLFLWNSDKRRYGSLVHDIMNEFTRDRDTYPRTLTSAYDYIVNYRGDRVHNGLDSDEGGLALYSESQDGGSGGRGSARGQNNGQGFGRGGCGRGAGRTTSTERHKSGSRNEETPNDDENTQFLLDNADNVSEETVNNYYDYHCVCLQQSGMGISNLRQVVLIDSCSSVNLIADPALLYNTHTVERRMRVQCNAGVRSTNQKGWLGTFLKLSGMIPGG
jgi:hypothetical protein